MKKLIYFFLCITTICVALILFEVKMNKSNEASNNDLYIYNWGDYIDPELIDKFEAEYGYNVIYETFDSNESMYVKVKENTSSYDVVIPSDYMVSKMIKEEMLNEIDKDKIPNLNNIDERFLNPSFDPNNQYSIPYFWGTVGILYNKDKLNEIGASAPVCYSDLSNPDYENNILLSDGAREVLTIGLAQNGFSLNTENEHELEIALESLEKIKPNIKAIVGDEIKLMMVKNEAMISLGWSGDASYMMELNPALEYVVPCEGGNIWLDNMVIPKTAKNIDGAYDFINFMLEDENAFQNALYVGYESPVTSVINEMSGDNEFIYPDSEITDKLEYYEYISDEQIDLYSEYYLEFKMNF